MSLHLHSLPTRRSSDLLDLYFKGLSLRSIANHLSQNYSLHVSYLTIYRWIKKYVHLIVAYAKHLEPRVSRTWHRSEEHTSELQSRENLVCRLLLEKKKH